MPSAAPVLSMNEKMRIFDFERGAMLADGTLYAIEREQGSRWDEIARRHGASAPRVIECATYAYGGVEPRPIAA